MPVVVEAVPPLVLIALLLVSLAFAVAARKIVEGLGGVLGFVVGHIPWLGNAASSAVHDVERVLISPIVSAEQYIDNQIAVCWHKLARLAQWQAHEIEQHAKLLALIAGLLTGGLSAKQRDELTGIVAGYLHRLVHAAGSVIHETIAKTVYVYRTVNHYVVPKVGSLSKSVAVALPRELDRLRSRERALAHEVDVVIPRDLAALRKQAAADAAHGIGLFRWLRQHATAAASVAFAGAVAIALRRLGLGWVRCANWRRIGKTGCGLDASLLESLLADAALLAGTYSLVEFAREMVGVTETAVRPIVSFWQAD